MAKARTFSSGKSQSSNFNAICSSVCVCVRRRREGRGRPEGREEGGGKEEGKRREKGGRREEGGKGTQEGSTTIWEAVPQQGKLVLQRPAGPRESRPQDSHKDSPSSPSVCTREQPG